MDARADRMRPPACSSPVVRRILGKEKSDQGEVTGLERKVRRSKVTKVTIVDGTVHSPPPGSIVSPPRPPPSPHDNAAAVAAVRACARHKQRECAPRRPATRSVIGGRGLPARRAEPPQKIPTRRTRDLHSEGASAAPVIAAENNRTDYRSLVIAAKIRASAAADGYTSSDGP